MGVLDQFSQFFDIGKDVLATYLSKTTNVILAQIGDAVSGIVESNSAEWWQHTGYASRPAVPVQGKPACQTIAIKRGNRDYIIATRDTRNATIYGNLKDGETCVYSSSAQCRTLWKADGSIWNVTTIGNQPGGTTFAVQQGSDGSFTIQAPKWLFQGDANGKITIGNQACGLTMDPITGKVHIFGTIVQVQASGVAMVSGDVMTLLGNKAVPLPINGAAYTVAGPVNVISTNVIISP